MISVNYHSELGTPMSDSECLSFPEKVKERIGTEFVFFISNELALYALGLSIIKGDIDPSQVCVEFNGETISIDKDGMLSEFPSGLMDKQELVCREHIMARLGKSDSHKMSNQKE